MSLFSERQLRVPCPLRQRPGGRSGTARRRLLLAAAALAALLAPGGVVAQARTPQAGIDPDGAGAFVRDGGLELRLLGYIQPVLGIFPHELDRPDAPAAFSIRRARVDLVATLGEAHTLFIELDGAPAARTALVEAWLDWRLVGRALRVRAGKFIGHFSAENLRSSRSLLTVERYMALNSMFFMPALDTQTGVLVHGSGLAAGRLGYGVGVYNGNGSASANPTEDNGTKEVQARVTFTPSPALTASLALDWTREAEQRVRLLDLGFNEYVGVGVAGERRGVGGDLAWSRGAWSVAAEGLGFRFDGVEGGDVGLWGGYLEPAWFVAGDATGGLQLLVRAETSRLTGGPPGQADGLLAVTLGGNYHATGNARLQVNAVAHRGNGTAPAQGFETARWIPVLLTQLQLKF